VILMGRFVDAIFKRKQDGFIPVIPDIKLISPKEGDLLRGRNPAEMAKLLSAAGAPVFSVVTEKEHFGGSLELMEIIIESTGRPVLRKDFIKNFDDLHQTRACGADAVLLICSMFTETSLRSLYEESLRIGLEPLIETHSSDELLLAGRMGATLVGINNRNILELEKDDGSVSLTESLSALIPEGALLISESGIHSYRDALAAINAGADAVLVGTAIWQADDPTDLYLSLSRRLDP